MDKFLELKKLAEKENILIGGGTLNHYNEAEITFCFDNKIDNIQVTKIPVNMPVSEMLERIKQLKKPPIGIKPHFIWIEQRMEEIRQGINRRIEAKVIVPHEWYIELAQLENERLKNTDYLVVDNSNFDIETFKAITKEGI